MVDVPVIVRHALLMLVAHYYENRKNELIGTISKILPHGFDDLIGMEQEAYYGQDGIVSGSGQVSTHGLNY